MPIVSYFKFYYFQCATLVCYVYVLYNEKFLAILLHAENENFKQMFYTILFSLTKDQKGPKYVGVGVL
jgi:hypothetical protein